MMSDPAAPWSTGARAVAFYRVTGLRIAGVLFLIVGMFPLIAGAAHHATSGGASSSR
jgi:hypothetical protein